MSDERNRGVLGLVIGLVAGMFFSTCACGLGGYVLIKKKQADVRRGWNLVPVVVAAQDIAARETVTFDKISQRSVPEQFVTGSIVTPDSAGQIVGQWLLVPVKAGDPLLWTQFPRDGDPALAECIMRLSRTPPGDSRAGRQNP